jgi:hypothetical protein
MSVRDKLVELSYVRWELRQRADAGEPAGAMARPAEPRRSAVTAQRVHRIQARPLTSS